MAALRALVLLLALFAAPAQAEYVELGGVLIQKQVEIDGEERPLRLSGAMLVERAFLPFQIIVLHLPQRLQSESELMDGLASFRLELIWLNAGLDPERTREYWRQGFDSVIDEQPVRERLAPRISELQRMLGAAQRGSRWAFEYTPDTGLELLVDGEQRGRLGGIEFVRLLLAQYIGARVPGPQRDRLLQGLRESA